MKFKPQRKEKIKWYKNKKILTSLVGVFIILIMVFSVLNMGDDEENTNEKYNDFTFVKSNNVWITYIDNNPVAFSYTPRELEDILMPSFNLNKEKFYVIYDSKEININDQLIQRLVAMLKYKGFNAFLACDKEEWCGNIPIINCSSNNALFYFKSDNSTKMYKEGNCIVLGGDRENLIKSVDRISYSILGVM